MIRNIINGGINLSVHDEGEGPAALLLHGFPDDHTVWRKQVPDLLTAGYRVIVPDMRGCGASDMGAGVTDYRLPLLVSDCVAILDALSLTKVALIGHDWGAVIGWHLAMAHPERISRYAALSVGHPTAYARGPIEQKLKAYYVLLFQLRGFAEALIKAGNWWFLRFISGEAEETVRWQARLSQPGRLTAAINYYRANLSLMKAHNRPKVPMPVLGLFSDGDRFLAQSQMQGSAAFCTGPFRFVMVKGAGHWMQLDDPKTVNAHCIAFLGEEERPCGDSGLK